MHSTYIATQLGPLLGRSYSCWVLMRRWTLDTPCISRTAELKTRCLPSSATNCKCPLVVSDTCFMILG